MNKLGLLVDDDPIFNWVSSKMIEKVDPGLTIKSCANGKEALDFLCENYTGETIYQILLDINMPRLNGWEFIEELEGIQTIKSDNVFIYIVSSSTDESDIKKADGLELVKGYFKKPLSIEDIKSIFG
ncbi:MAG: response regulator [Allomuricauda sp.]|jgi:CheY-like chemotaxis protein|uniref:response regulator n=1 Tax=Allomuricauda sp. CP2A TaxID=1848189 RepID=UPI000835CF17|nr:response regulator [Muricauda sp. CP2A]